MTGVTARVVKAVNHEEEPRIDRPKRPHPLEHRSPQVLVREDLFGAGPGHRPMDGIGKVPAAILVFGSGLLDGYFERLRRLLGAARARQPFPQQSLRRGAGRGGRPTGILLSPLRGAPLQLGQHAMRVLLGLDTSKRRLDHFGRLPGVLLHRLFGPVRHLLRRCQDVTPLSHYVLELGSIPLRGPRTS